MKLEPRKMNGSRLSLGRDRTPVGCSASDFFEATVD